MKNRFLLSTLAIACSTAAVGAETKSGEVKYGTNVDAENNKIEVKWCAESKTKCNCPADLSGDPNSGTPKDQCVQMNIPLGRPRYSALSDAIMLQLNELEATSALYSPSGFKVVAGSAVHSISRDKNSSGVPKWVQLVSPKGLLSAFVFTNGESVAKCTSGLAGRSAERLAMVDAQGWATASDPAFYDFYPGDGSRWRFGAARASPDYLQLVAHATADGRVETNQDIGLEIVRDADGVLRQVMSPGYLADFVVNGQDSYDLSVYPNDSTCVAETHTPEGYYQIVAGAVPVIVWKFRNPTPGTYGVLNVTREAPGTEPQTWQYTYVEAVRDFTLVHPGGVKVERLERISSDDGQAWVLRRSELDSGGVPYNVQEQHYVKGATSDTLVQSVRDPGGLNLATRYGYYSGGVRDGLEELTVAEDGSWVRFEYDDSCRVTAEIRPWLDAPTNAPNNQCTVTRYGYGLFASGDFLAYNDQRPRTEIKEICGVEVARTYHAYPTNALGQAQEIEERAAFPGAPYGHASTPRTVKTYYAASAALPLPGRLATVVYPGGKTETYGYEYGAFNSSTFAFTPDPDGGAWRETVTTSYGANSGVQALRSARVWDEKGREVLNESCVEDGAAFALIGWTRMSYDRNGKLIETAYSDGRVESATWGANCCGKESETSAEGNITVYGYNELKQKVSETKKGFAADGSDDITTLYTYDLENRLLSTAVTNIAAGLGFVGSCNAYDAVGRLTNALDRLGNATVYAYLGGTRERQSMPNGVTNVTERYLDGQTKRILVNGVVKQSYAYGVSPDGARWILSADGSLPVEIQTISEPPNFSALELLDFPWSLSSSDMLGRAIASEKPGFGGTTLIASNSYDNAGNLVTTTLCSVQSANPFNPVILSKSSYSYAADGSLYLTALDLNTNGVIDLEGPDRITGSSAGYEKDASDIWWSVSRSWVYPEFNSSAAVTTSVRRVRLTGLGVQRGDDGVRVSQAEALDVRGNATVSETLVDRADRKVTRVNALPTSVQPEIQVTVNGLLLKTVSSSAVTNTFGYDVFGRQTSSTDGRGNTSVTAYNSAGHVLYIEDAATNRTTYGYDSLGRRTSVTDALGYVTHMRYDSKGRAVATWGATYPVAYAYDTDGRIVQMGTYRGATEITDYASFKSLVSSFDKTVWLYDQPTGLLTNKLYADGKGPSYTYTSDGKFATRTWARDVVTIYAYAPFSGELTSIDYSDDTPDIACAYDRLGNTASAADASGTRIFINSADGQIRADTIQVNGRQYTLHEFQDAFGRSSGYALSNTIDGVSTLITDTALRYDPFSRFSVCSVGNIPVPFRYAYLPGSDLVQSLAMPNGVTRQTTYDPHRALQASITHTNVSGTVLTRRMFAYDASSRLTGRTQSRLGDETNRLDAFGYNLLSEVTKAVIGTNDYSYAFDPIGNRQTAEESDSLTTYTANPLNQYTNITSQSYGLQPDSFSPVFDADGNQTLLKTTTGIWHVRYNGENRPVCFSNDTAVVDMDYDYMGRRFFYRETVSNNVMRHELHLYRDYLRITTLDILNTNAVMHTIVWDPTEPAAARPLLLSTPSGWHTYGFDQVKNVTELFDAVGELSATYDYAPFGAITKSSGPAVLLNPVTFSSEIDDALLGIVYYNWRHLNVLDGRWLNRDPAGENEGLLVYGFVVNAPSDSYDLFGLSQKSNCESVTFSDGFDFALPQIGPVRASVSANVSLSTEVCKVCCSSGELVEDTTVSGSGYVRGSASGGGWHFNIDEGAAGYGGELFLGVRATLSVQGGVGGEARSDMCNNVPLQGAVCLQGGGSLMLEGGGSATIRVGKRLQLSTGLIVSGGGSVTVSKCYTCANGSCAWEKTKICLSGVASVQLMLAHKGALNYVFWESKKCW